MVNLCKISIPSQVTTVMVRYHRVLEVPQEAPASVTREIGGNLDCCEKLRPGRLADGPGGKNGNRIPWFFTITRLLGAIASWGFGVIIHHFQQEIDLVGEKLWNKRNNQTRIAAESGLTLCTVTNARHHRFKLFSSYEEFSFFC